MLYVTRELLPTRSRTLDGLTNLYLILYVFEPSLVLLEMQYLLEHLQLLALTIGATRLVASGVRACPVRGR